MRIRDMRNLALPALFELAKKGQVTITYQYENGKGDALYDVVSAPGTVLCSRSTEYEILQKLSKEESKSESLSRCATCDANTREEFERTGKAHLCPREVNNGQRS